MHGLAVAEVIGNRDPRALSAADISRLQDLLESARVRRILDAGYPDAEIKAARAANHADLAAHAAAVDDVKRFCGVLVGSLG